MKALTIRGVDDTTYDGLKDLARKNRRSLQEQVRLILEREVSLCGGDSWAQAQDWRERLAGRTFRDVVAEVREDRER